METYIIQGEDRKECELKIMEKYKKPFHIVRQKDIRIGGIFGLFSREGVEVEFYFSPILANPLWPAYQAAQSEAAPLNFEEAKKKVLAASGKNPEEVTALAAARIAAETEKENSQKAILDGIREIKQTLEAGGAKQEEHPSLARIAELLKLNDFSERYIEDMIARCKKELSLDTLANFDEVQARTLEWIGGSIGIYREAETRRKGRIIVLVGPTGVGKTTTIAKLAAIFGIENSGREALSVRMITIDAFRIGAREQLEKYGNIMDIPVTAVDNRQDLRKEIALYSEVTDIFFVDTFGKSPNDAIKLGEMKELLDGCGPRAETHLVISAGTKTSDIAGILRQFEIFNYRSVVLTKLDETSHIGNVISVLAEKRKPVSYITDGQTVPDAIKKATIPRFLINLEEFKVDRDSIEKRFPAEGADQFQWSYH